MVEFYSDAYDSDAYDEAERPTPSAWTAGWSTEGCPELLAASSHMLAIART